MRKLLTMFLGYCCAVPVLACLIAIYQPSARVFPNQSSAWRLADFAERLDKYRASEPPQTVFIGPCYVQTVLDEASEMPHTSLCMGGLRQSEIEYILKHYVRPSDRVCVPITFHNISTQSLPIRREIASRAFRNISLWRSRIRYALSLESYQPPLPAPVTKQQIAAYREATETQYTEAICRWALPEVISAKPYTDAEIDRFHRFVKDYPTVHFILFPTLRLKRVMDTSLRSAVDNAKIRDRQIQRIGKAYNWQDLSSLCNAADFTTTNHLSPRGAEKVANYVVELFISE